MGHRLSKIVTRTGDAGDTGLAGGGRVRKTDPRIAALGDVDELNSQLGVLLAQRVPRGLRASLLRIQHELFNLGGELSMPGASLVAPEHLAGLERDIEALNAALPPLKEFVLPGGNGAAAAAHLARAICRRAERSVWALHEHAEKGVRSFSADRSRHRREKPQENDLTLFLAARYLNRLSDFLFVAARALARAQGGKETQWRGTSRGRR
jgi:cob(I)alamin adenosyltransferase